MPKKIKHIDVDYVVKEYEQGISASSIARKYGVCSKTIVVILKNNNIRIRQPGELLKQAHTEKTIVKMNKFSEKIVSMHNNGMSCKSIAEKTGECRDFVKRCLEYNGIKPRNRSEAMYKRMEQTSKEDRKKLAYAANEAVRNHGFKEEASIRIAKARQHMNDFIGKGENTFAKWMIEKGYNVTQQKAIGRYNIDIYCDNLAIEIHSNATHPHTHKKTIRRIKYLLNNGHNVLYIKASQGETNKKTGEKCRSFILKEICADYAISFLEESKTFQDEYTEYRAIRGNGDYLCSYHMSNGEFISK